MKYLQGKSWVNKYCCLVFLLCSCICYCSCTNSKENRIVSGIYFDTFVTVTTYEDTSTDLLNGVLKECEKYELVFSPTNPNSELYKINNRIGSKDSGDNLFECNISNDLYECLEAALLFSYETDGAYSPVLGSVIELWDYHADNPTIPSDDILHDAILASNIEDVKLSDVNGIKSICIYNDDLKIDLGGAAKGYIANKLKQFMIDNGCKEAVIALGGNVYCLGNKNNAGYNVGIQKPFSNKGDAIISVNVVDTSVVTSGIYERFFEQNGKIYHHIIDAKTGYPVDNDLLSASVICDDSLKADMLSTALLCMGKDRAKEYLVDNNIYVILIDVNNEIIEINK